MYAHLTAGCDEVGTGAFAGPIVIGFCILGHNTITLPLKDSKAFNSEAKRQETAKAIREQALWCCTKKVDHYLTYSTVIQTMCAQIEAMYPGITLIIDGDKHFNIPRLNAVVKADATHPTVSAASIIAKVYHDDYMNSINTRVDFGFKNHKGYGTPEHIKALNQYGPIRGVHRENIDKVKKALKSKGWYK